MIVLEEWKRDGWYERLIVTRHGNIRAQYRGLISGRWHPWDGGLRQREELPLFAPAKKQRRPK